MKKIQVLVDSFEPFRERFPIWSKICIKVDDLCFPDKAWIDATSSILVIWIDNLIKVLNGSTNTVDLFFLDADCSMKIVSTSLHKVCMFLYSSGERIATLEEVDMLYFTRQVLSASSKFMQQYQQFCYSQQVQEVSDAAARLRRQLRNSTLSK